MVVAPVVPVPVVLGVITVLVPEALVPGAGVMVVAPVVVPGVITVLPEASVPGAGVMVVEVG